MRSVRIFIEKIDSRRDAKHAAVLLERKRWPSDVLADSVPMEISDETYLELMKKSHAHRRKLGWVRMGGLIWLTVSESAKAEVQEAAARSLLLLP